MWLARNSSTRYGEWANPWLAKNIITQYGGPDGNSASLRF